MWSIEHTETTKANPEQLWQQYEDYKNGPTWDPMVAEIRLNGPFVTGTTGTNKPPTGPRLNFVLTEVTPFSTYTEITKAIGANMLFTHEITPTATGTVFKHGITCTGPLSGLYAVLFKKSYTRLLPIAMMALAQTAERPVIK